MTTTLADLPDVNVWIALSAQDHVFHERARHYWETEAAEVLVFCRHTALGFVRIAGQVHTPNGAARTPAEAWTIYSEWLAQPGVSLALEASGIDAILQRWVHAGLIAQRTWADAYLAALAISAGHRLVTFDGDFQRFPGLDLLKLSP